MDTPRTVIGENTAHVACNKSDLIFIKKISRTISYGQLTELLGVIWLIWFVLLPEESDGESSGSALFIQKDLVTYSKRAYL